MNALVEFFKKNSYWFLFVLLEVVSAWLMFGYNSYQNSVWITQAGEVAAKVNGLYSQAEAFVRLGEANRQLTKQNSLLQMQVNQLRERLKDTTAVLTKVEMQMRDTMRGYRLYEAKVVSSSILRHNNHLIINRGFNDGIRAEMGVVGAGGVVGIVTMTGRHYSTILPIINTKSRISCRLRNSDYFGTLLWDGGNVRYAKVVGVPRYATVKRGDAVETSGYSTMFPPGLFVGNVKRIEDGPDGLSKQLTIALGTDFGNLRNVTVFRNLHRAEIQGLHNRLKETQEE